LGKGLAVADRQWMILVGVGARGLGNEDMARHTGNGVEHALVAHVAAAELLRDHPLTGRVPVAGAHAIIIRPPRRLRPPLISTAELWRRPPRAIDPRSDVRVFALSGQSAD
jgi:hypothetical protein